MKLTKALKLKNQLVGEINALKEIFKRENSRRNDNPSKIDCSKVFIELTDKREQLIKLKASISKANVDIYDKINRMAELKDYINFLNGLPKREGEELTLIGLNREKLMYNWTAYLNQEEVDKLVNSLKEDINALQDAVDNYNAVKDI